MAKAGIQIENLVAAKKPCVVDFRLDPTENVWPMVAAGKGLHEMDGLGIFEMAY